MGGSSLFLEKKGERVLLLLLLLLLPCKCFLTCSECMALVRQRTRKLSSPKKKGAKNAKWKERERENGEKMEKEEEKRWGASSMAMLVVVVGT